MFDWPNYANAGDHFIWLGEKLILKQRLACEVLAESSLQRVDFLALTLLPKDTVFLIHGGGNLGDLYPHHQKYRDAIISAFPERRIVVMPQTVFFQDRSRLDYAARHYAQHPDLHLIARDQESLDILRSQMGCANTYLHIDSTFALQPIVDRLVKFLDVVPTQDELRLLRRDAETGQGALERTGSVDWASHDGLTRFAGLGPNVAEIDIARDIFTSEFDIKSWRRLCGAVRLFGAARRIVTDRLHGHVLASMMGKEHSLYDNNYGKNSSFCRVWSHSDPSLKLLGSRKPLDSTGSETAKEIAAPCDLKVRIGLDAIPQKKLAVIVPYRNRELHLKKFLPHLISYFRRDVIGKALDVKILLVEQDDDLPFNRGGLLNTGFLAIADRVDYVCFHDVDYLPLWADYSYAEAPTRIIWWGMHWRPIRVKGSSLRTEAPRTGLGAVTLFTTHAFRAVNGFSNKFFGWGFEDKDLAARSSLHSLSIEQRDGTFIPLDHDNVGFNDDGSKSTAWLENERRFDGNQRDYSQHGAAREGLSSFTGQTSPIQTVRVSGLDGVENAEVMYLSVNFDSSPARQGAGMQALALLQGMSTAADRSVAARGLAGPAIPSPPVVKVKRSSAKKICLSMIVKNEAAVIARCLASVRPLIDHWVIVDTGSTDGTQEIIRQTLSDLPGNLYERPWVDFGHSRTEALRLAKPLGDYTLIIDADDVLEFPPDFKLPALVADSYTVEIRNKYRRYWRPQLIRNSLPWRYEGVLHEFLSCGFDNKNRRVLPEGRSQKRLPDVRIVMSEEGARRRVESSDRFKRDAETLETALKTEADPFLVARYNFYLAQSYMDAGDKPKALGAYLERSRLGYWNQEVFISLYRAANIKMEIGEDAEEILQTYRRASVVVGDRAEALHGAAKLCRTLGRFQEGYDFAKRALKIPTPNDGLFVEQWIYDYGALDEFAVNAYWTGRYQDCINACRRILAGKSIPDAQRPRVEKNIEFALARQREFGLSESTGRKG